MIADDVVGSVECGIMADTGENIFSRAESGCGDGGSEGRFTDTFCAGSGMKTLLGFRGV